MKSLDLCAERVYVSLDTLDGDLPHRVSYDQEQAGPMDRLTVWSGAWGLDTQRGLAPGMDAHLLVPEPVFLELREVFARGAHILANGAVAQ